MTAILATIALWCMRPHETVTAAYMHLQVDAQRACRNKMIACVGLIKPEEKILQCAKDNNP